MPFDHRPNIDFEAGPEECGAGDCGEACSPDDPVWNDQAYHLECVPLDAVVEAALHGCNAIRCRDARTIFRMLAESAERRAFQAVAGRPAKAYELSRGDK